MKYLATAFHGGMFLDEHAPLWHRSIDLDKLEMVSDLHCVLAQLHGSFGNGQIALGLTDARSIALGFQLDVVGMSDETMALEFEALTEAWSWEISWRCKGDGVRLEYTELAGV